MKSVILGLGYVGLANVAYLAEHVRTSLIAFDTDEAKISAIKGVQFPYEEPLLNKVLSQNARKILYTSKEEDIKDADLYFLCVGTPSEEDGSADLSALNSAVELIQESSDKSSDYHPLDRSHWHGEEDSGSTSSIFHHLDAGVFSGRPFL
jgi:UDPglucose 6-dehydrogenase